MNYEKAYKEALERARQVHTTNVDENKKSTEYIFPELAESEDEKIRKQLLNWFKDCHWDSIDDGTLKRDDIIAWLEKQDDINQNWKPTKEQYEALDYAYNRCSDTERGNYYEGVLETLIEDLHRLEKQDEWELYEPVRKKPTAWSEEDEKHVNSILIRLEGLCRKEFLITKFAINEDEDWLKSLKERI